ADGTAAWAAQRGRLALDRSRCAGRRDRALLAVKSNRAGVAVRLLKSLMNSCPEDEREFLSEQLDEAGRQVARWN
ncbi:MAG: hypothetical protein H8E37_06200, partial [Planctomycetes bacterium]|nr:hypothetical protein [Planctomycetota bacterium]